MQNNNFSGKCLRGMRELQKLSQMALAYEIDTTQNTISLWERGKIVPTDENVKKLCTALHCEKADLYKRMHDGD